MSGKEFAKKGEPAGDLKKGWPAFTADEGTMRLRTPIDVVEQGAYAGNCDVKVLWQTHTEPVTADSKLLKVVGS